MKANRPHREAQAHSPLPPVRAEVVAALLALLAQIVLPPVHRWQVAEHRAPDQGLHAVARAPAFDASHAESGHAETTCPICQALAASHGFLAPAPQRRAPAPSALADAALLAAHTAQTRTDEHAPRSPPRFA